MLLREVMVEDDCRVLIGYCLVVVVVAALVVDGTGEIVVVAAAAVVTSVVVAAVASASVVVVDLDIDYTAAADDNLDPIVDLVDFVPDSIAD